MSCTTGEFLALSAADCARSRAAAASLRLGPSLFPTGSLSSVHECLLRRRYSDCAVSAIGKSSKATHSQSWMRLGELFLVPGTRHSTSREKDKGTATDVCSGGNQIAAYWRWKEFKNSAFSNYAHPFG